jgi:hypothetical protein
MRDRSPGAELRRPSGLEFSAMIASAALQNEGSWKSPSRADLLARYRRLREIAMIHQCRAMAFVSRDAMLHHARRLGMANGLTRDNSDGLTLPLDLAIYTAPGGRAAAIDRYAKSAQFAAGSDEALVLEAMCNASFAIVSVERRHPSAGLIVNDLLRNRELWLVDEVLEQSAPQDSAFATRFFSPEVFTMTTGVATPVDAELLASALKPAPQLLRMACTEAIDDWRFAEAIYRAAIAQANTSPRLRGEVAAR